MNTAPTTADLAHLLLSEVLAGGEITREDAIAHWNAEIVRMEAVIAGRIASGATATDDDRYMVREIAAIRYLLTDDSITHIPTARMIARRGDRHNYRCNVCRDTHYLAHFASIDGGRCWSCPADDD